MTRVLFVCLGNICRSPAAEGVMRALADRAGADLTLDSAGTSDWHIGDAPYGPMQAAAERRGYDLAPLRARQAVAADFDRFDLIVAMDAKNRADLEALRPAGNNDKSGAHVWRRGRCLRPLLHPRLRRCARPDRNRGASASRSAHAVGFGEGSEGAVAFPEVFMAATGRAAGFPAPWPDRRKTRRQVSGLVRSVSGWPPPGYSHKAPGPPPARADVHTGRPHGARLGKARTQRQKRGGTHVFHRQPLLDQRPPMGRRLIREFEKTMAQVGRSGGGYGPDKGCDQDFAGTTRAASPGSARPAPMGRALLAHPSSRTLPFAFTGPERGTSRGLDRSHLPTPRNPYISPP